MVSYATPLGLLCPVMKAVSYTTPPGLLRTVRPPGSSGVNNFAKKCNQRDKNMNLRDLYHFGVTNKTVDKTHREKTNIWTPQGIDNICQAKKLILFKGLQRPFKPLWTNCL
ncbi:hypothetical protein ACFE04_011119 [Oxalis oulophora]